MGSLGAKNDYNIISLPGTRRAFLKHLSKDSYIKNDFTDIETDDGIKTFLREFNNKKVKNDNPNNDSTEIPETLLNAINNYYKVILACTVVNPNKHDDCKKVIKKYLALYANLRGWPTVEKKIKHVNEALNTNISEESEENKITELLKSKKYIVLQEAPGTGKTRMAKKITKDADKNNIFFTQFHAETSYSDFIYSIRPSVSSNNLSYETNDGIFVKAIKRAKECQNSNKNEVYLIIDEINRANLSNVLGSAFYLLEPSMSDSNIEIEVCPGLKLSKLPENLYVIATMNTADRSLAVVDFALRRRFAWYTLRPHTIKETDKYYVFRNKEFNAISYIFEKYATDEELNLQPGHAYFIVPEKGADAAMEMRLKYEIMPLIKEYLLDGMLTRAKDDFVNYFRNAINEEMFY